MSLFRQIALISIFFQTLTLSIVIYQNFSSVNSQIQNRLLSDAQDTAISLGLSISMVVDSPESDTYIKTMINAIFDSGYYQSIVLKDIDEKLIYEKHNPKTVYKVPQWFVSYISFNSPVAKSEIMSGWNRFGTIYVTNNNGHAYLQLWNVFIKLLQWFGFILVVSIAILYFLLRLVFKPLKKVQLQAEGILHHEFLINNTIPFTTEFRDVTSAMNSMIIKVKDIFKRETDTLKQYRALLCFDQEFNVANRHNFMNTLSGYLDEKGNNAFGIVIIIKFEHFDQFKNKYGYDIYVKYTQELLDILETIGKEHSKIPTVARFSSSSYALLIPNRDIYKQMETIAINLLEKINKIQLTLSYKESIKSSFSIGISQYSADMEIKTIMTHSDYALLQAELIAENSFYIYHEKNELNELMLRGREVWVQSISEAIKHNHIELVTQKCLDTDTNEIFHKELYTKMYLKDKTVISAHVFLPIAKYAKLLDKIDLYLLQTISKKNHSNFALNISIESIKNNTFINLVQEIAYTLSLKRKQPHLHFEINLNSIGSDINSVVAFSKILKRLGYTFGIDHFLFLPESIELIEKIAPSYLKIDVNQLQNYADHSNFDMIRSIHNIVSTYGVDIIATNVENEQQKLFLNKIGIHLIQGRYIKDILPLDIKEES